MCLLIYRAPHGSNPTEDELRRAFAANPHGAGYAWTTPAGVRWRKGIMTADGLIASLDAAAIPADAHMIIHLRLATHGPKTAALCHPFPVTEDEETIGRKRGLAPSVLAHNGILSVELLPGHSDTSSFVLHTYAAPKVFEDTGVDEIADLIDRACTGSRVVELTTHGPVFYGSLWTDRRPGLFFSNENFEPVIYISRNYLDEREAAWERNWGDWKKPAAVDEHIAAATRKEAHRKLPKRFRWCGFCGNHLELDEEYCAFCMQPVDEDNPGNLYQ